MLGRPGSEITLQHERAQSLAGGINARLTRGDGIYIDGLDGGGRPSSHASQHANAEALAFGVVPPGRRDSVGAYVEGLGMAMGPMTVEALLHALHVSDRDDALVALLRNADVPGWANILARGGTFT